MRLVLGAHNLDLPAGGVTYFATVAEHIQRLGHDVTAFTREPGVVSESLEERGIAVADPRSLPEECDAILAQDAPSSYELAERYPRTPQVFVAHGLEFDFEMPPQVPGVVGKVVALNDRVQRGLGTTSLDAEVVRLRQPIDSMRFHPRVEPAAPPRRAVLLGNYLRGPRRDAVTAALGAAGVRWVQLGRTAEMSHDPAIALGEADLVIGYGRSILEGMSAGCAAYVAEFAIDGWVTAESYPAIEADGFAGTAFDDPPDPGRLARDLAAYDPAMGIVNRELIATGHTAHLHAQDLVDLMENLDPRPAASRQAAEMARLVRLEWGAQLRAAWHERRLLDMQREKVEAQDRAVAAERRALEAEGRLGEIKRSARYRLAQRLAAPLDAARFWRR